MSFDFRESGGPRYVRPPMGWLQMFSAVLAANVIAAVLILLGVRMYVMWSIQETIEKIESRRPAPPTLFRP